MSKIIRVIPLLLSAYAWEGSSPSVSAQPILVAPDGTGTVITPQQSPAGTLQLDISGGTQAGSNLFHSFQQFGLDSNQIANFLSRPGIETILGRVVGGNVSVINGLIQVSGGSANLYLMNPAGILFGPNASLNLPAAFTATTATSIGIGSGWFNAVGSNNYASLVGSPNSFAFLTPQAGTIVNAGNLAVGQGQSLTLLGGTVINTGTLTAPGGQITIAAIPGEQRVRITESGNLLSLDLPVTATAPTTPLPFTPLSLPQLLTGGYLTGATGVTVENGVVRLTSSGTTLPTERGTAIVSGQVSVATQQASAAPGQITILGNTVGVLNANLSASGTYGGGTIRIGGEYQGRGPIPNAQTTVVDATTRISADALLQGNGGRIIVWADDTTRFRGTITARGGELGGNGGFVETSGKQGLDITGATVDTRAIDQVGTWLLDPSNITISDGTTTASNNPDFFSSLDGAVINRADLTNALLTSDVSITTAGAGTGNGDIFLTTPFTSDVAGRTLTLDARYLIPSNGATISLLGANSNLVINLNTVNPSSAPVFGTIQRALSAIGTINGSTTLNLGAGTYAEPVTLNATNTTSLSIRGAGADRTLIDGKGEFRPFTIQAGTVTLDSLSILNGVGLEGGGILNNGALTVSNSALSGNQANNFGGAIFNSANGTLTVSNSTLSNNSASNGGGGIFNSGTSVLQNNTVVQGNRAINGGGGIANERTLTLNDTVVTGNTTGNSGGGIANGVNGILTVTNSRLSENQTGSQGGSLYNTGQATIANSQLVNNQAVNQGGGIYNEGRLDLTRVNLSSNRANNQAGGVFNNGVLTAIESLFSQNQATNNAGGIFNASRFSLTSSTVRDNTALDGGGIFNIGELGFDRSTLSGNQAGSLGGGLLNRGSLNVRNATISGNTAAEGGGILNESSLEVTNSTITRNQALIQGGGLLNRTSTVQIGNTILARNTSAAAPDVWGNVTDLGGNLVGIRDGSVGFNPSPLIGTGTNPIDPLLGPLADNGGPTQTHALLPGSPAIGGGDAAIALPIDQQGQARSNDVLVDSGSFSSQTPVPPPVEPVLVPPPADPRPTPAPVDPVPPPADPRPTPAPVDPVPPPSDPRPTPAPVDPIPFPPPSDPRPTPAPVDPIPFPPPSDPRPTLPPVDRVPLPSDPRPTPSPLDPELDPAPIESLPIPFPMGSVSGLSGQPVSVESLLESAPIRIKVFPKVAEFLVAITQSLPQMDKSLQPSIDSSKPTGASRSPLPLQSGSASQRSDIALAELDQSFSRDYTQRFKLRQAASITNQQLQATLAKAKEKTGVGSAVIYAVFVPPVISPAPSSGSSGDNSASVPLFFRSGEKRAEDRLELILITPSGRTIRRSTNTTRAHVLQQAKLFRLAVSDPEDNRGYVALARQLHSWLLQPIEADLAQEDITNLIYCLDEGLRTAPIAAMINDKGFAIERYQFSIIPSVGLLSQDVTNLENQSLLALGVDRFQSLDPLPAVPIEVGLVSQKFLGGQSLLNQDSTLTEMLARRSQNQSEVLHLATHAQFNEGAPNQSFIQLWDTRLTLDQLRTLQWGRPPLELLVLSACTTAVGSADAELGFAGLAAASGVRTVLGSLWTVSDVGTLALMSEFYSQLRAAPTRAEALRRAQLALLNGKVRIERGSLITSTGTFPLPAELTASGTIQFNHPFYWSAFTLVGNPW